MISDSYYCLSRPVHTYICKTIVFTGIHLCQINDACVTLYPIIMLASVCNIEPCSSFVYQVGEMAHPATTCICNPCIT